MPTAGLLPRLWAGLGQGIRCWRPGGGHRANARSASPAPCPRIVRIGKRARQKRDLIASPTRTSLPSSICTICYRTGVAGANAPRLRAAQRKDDFFASCKPELASQGAPGVGAPGPFPLWRGPGSAFPLRHSPKLWPQPCSASIRRGGARRAVGCSGSASRGDDRAAVHTRVPVDPRVGYPPGNGPTCLSCSAGPPREGRASVRCPFARAREARRGKASTREILSGPTQPASSRIAVPSPIPSGAVLARFAEACNAISDDLARTSVFTRVACRGARARGQV